MHCVVWLTCSVDSVSNCRIQLLQLVSLKLPDLSTDRSSLALGEIRLQGSPTPSVRHSGRSSFLGPIRQIRPCISHSSHSKSHTTVTITCASHIQVTPAACGQSIRQSRSKLCHKSQAYSSFLRWAEHPRMGLHSQRPTRPGPTHAGPTHTGPTHADQQGSSTPCPSACCEQPSSQQRRHIIDSNCLEHPIVCGQGDFLVFEAICRPLIGATRLHACD